MRMAKSMWLICALSLVLAVGSLVATAQTPADIYGADANPTGEPIGGGEGYSKLILNGDYTVTNKEELLNALARAKAGEVIYIDPQAEINLTGYQNIDIRAGITIAGNRGYQGSPGPLIYTNQHKTYPAFIRVIGNNVRITGIRLQGPSPEVPDSVAINVLANNVEIDNCEVYNWSYAGIASTGSRDLYIHHSYLHHIKRPGLGYPIVLKSAVALIEANIFDHYRHAIAGTGHAGTSYEARYNLVKGNAISHAFDMHGGTDFCPNQSIPCTPEELVMAGEFINIHHNTFEIINYAAIRVRGIPTVGLEVHHNWFKSSNQNMGVQFRYFRGGNSSVYDNVYGLNKHLIEVYASPSPYIYEEGSTAIYALAKGGKIEYGFVNPSALSGKPYRGDLAIEVMPVQMDESFGKKFIVSQVEVRLDNDNLLYSGEKLPAPGEVVIDTLKLNDGTHNLSIKISGNLDAPLEQTVIFQIDNWWDFDDSLEAPADSGWFGVIDKALTSDTSSGWTYATDDPAAFCNDDSRRVRTSTTEEYLTWKLNHIQQFQVKVYAKTATPEGLTLWASTDDEVWERLSYNVQASDANEQGWYCLTLTGTLPTERVYNWFRLNLAGGKQAADTQIGEVIFRGQHFDE